MHADNQAHVSQSASGRLNMHMATLFQASRNAMQTELCQAVPVQSSYGKSALLSKQASSISDNASMSNKELPGCPARLTCHHCLSLH